MVVLILSILLYTSSFANTLEVTSTDYKYQDAPEFQAIMAKLKTFGEFSAKALPQKELPAEKPISRGAQMVEEAKAKNRAIIAEQNKQERVQLEKESTSTSSELEKWKAEEKRNLNEWKKESKAQLNAWKREQEIFLGRIKVYKENTFSLPIKVEKIVEKSIPLEVVPEVSIVNAAFSIPIRDQSARPTCVAFAGARAIEMILVQNNRLQDLSEQYLYWSGKPSCQKSPCSEKGSWIVPAYQYSKNHAQVDIPLEEDCLYKGVSVAQNETQLPLTPSCLRGSAKVQDYVEVRTILDVVEKLKKNTPVIVAARLSENFYKNQGLITLADSVKKSSGKMDGHAMGHAFLAVGVIELPDKLKDSEGNFCLVVANSWGRGWGVGGYSCITEKWFEKYRQPSPFVSVTKIKVN